MRGKVIGVAMMGIALALASYAVADDPAPAATLTLTESAVGAGIGFSWAKGVLTYRGQKYPVTAKGLSVGEVGVTRAEASGSVYNLRTLADFDGSYTSAEAGVTVAGGASVAVMRNQNGVVIKLVSTTQGANLKLAAEGITLRLAK